MESLQPQPQSKSIKEHLEDFDLNKGLTNLQDSYLKKIFRNNFGYEFEDKEKVFNLKNSKLNVFDKLVHLTDGIYELKTKMAEKRKVMKQIKFLKNEIQKTVKELDDKDFHPLAKMKKEKFFLF